MKTCGLCRVQLPESSFYKNTHQPDGLSSSCRDCHRAWRRDHYRRNKAATIASVRAWDSKHPEEVRAYAAKHNRKRMETPEVMHMHAIYTRVRKAIKSGLIVPEPCRICQSPLVVAHHEDYARPYDVLWYCKRHHSRLHEIVGSRRHTLPLAAHSPIAPKRSEQAAAPSGDRPQEGWR